MNYTKLKNGFFLLLCTMLLLATLSCNKEPIHSLEEHDLVNQAIDLRSTNPDLITKDNYALYQASKNGSNYLVAGCLIKNISSYAGAASGGVLRYYLSNDNTWDTSDTFLGFDTYPALQPEETSEDWESIRIDLDAAGISNGNYFVIFVVDYTDTTSEGTAGEANNTNSLSFAYQ